MKLQRGPGRFPVVLATVFTLFFALLAVHPASREVWWAENIPVMAMFALLAATYRRFRYSDTAYAMMAVWLFLHTIGGHYTFANVPFGFVTDLFGFSRNHFDRVAHFSVGFYAYPLAELLTRKRLAHPTVALLFGLTAIMAVACAYEIIEWGYAVLEGGEAGVEFLGSQGDVWDAQKDMLADTLGAVFALAVFRLRRGFRETDGAARPPQTGS
jgi:putative membrane protein